MLEHEGNVLPVRNLPIERQGNRKYRDFPYAFPYHLCLFMVIEVTECHLTNRMVNDKNSERNPELPILKEVRERLGMTQEQIADCLGISRRTVIRHEAGERVIKLNFAQIRRLKELLEQAGMSIDDLPDNID